MAQEKMQWRVLYTR